MRQIESAVLEDQVVSWLLERARITERPMTFAELTGFGRHEHEHDHDHQHDPEPAPGGAHEQQEADGT
jgi:hypothetical protein